MRTLKTIVIVVSLLSFVGCEYQASRQVEEKKAASSVAATEPAQSQPAGQFKVAEKSDKTQGVTDSVNNPQQARLQQVSLKQADQSQSVAEAYDRKIIKDGEFTLEVPSPTESERRVTSIAEAHGGFVVTSESKQRQSNDPTQRLMDVTLVMRVPSNQFGPVVDEIRGLSKTITQNKTTGQDVTEEFIDLEARIKTQKALEAQFLEIMKQAHKVEDALEVQRQIAEVRSEIEKLEGRKRFLENRSSLSTITVNLKAPETMIVSTTGFGQDLKDAAKRSIDVATGIVLFLIQFVIVMLPIFVLIILPGGYIVRYFLRRARRLRLARELASDMQAPAQSA